jgi:hypothetical protein
MDKKNELEELKKSKKIYVEVIQNGELVNIWKNEKQNILHFLGFLYQVYVIKSFATRCRYEYNYSDYQKITFINKFSNYDESVTITKYIFHNIPTELGYLNILKLDDILEKKEV